MAKTDYVRARVDLELKNQAQAILEAEGFTVSSAITMMLRQVVLQGKLPFPVGGSLKFNARVQAACEASDRGEGEVTAYENSAAFFESLGISKP
jgi:DNA-damage-inducible protein J